jgi:hypothetical protein
MMSSKRGFSDAESGPFCFIFGKKLAKIRLKARFFIGFYA